MADASSTPAEGNVSSIPAEGNVSSTLVEGNAVDGSQDAGNSVPEPPPSLPVKEDDAKKAGLVTKSTLSEEVSRLREELKAIEEKIKQLESRPAEIAQAEQIEGNGDETPKESVEAVAAEEKDDAATKADDEDKKSDSSEVKKDEDAKSVTSSSTKSDIEKPVHVPAIPEVRKVEWDGFNNIIKGNKKVHAVEVLVGNPRFYWQKRRDEMNRNRQMEEGASLKPQQRDPDEIADGAQRRQQEMPERMRINSTPLMTILKDVLNSDMIVEPTVFLRPYKPFSHHETDLKKWMKYLTKKWKSKAEEMDKEKAAGEENESAEKDDDSKAEKTKPNTDEQFTKSLNEEASTDKTANAPGDAAEIPTQKPSEKTEPPESAPRPELERKTTKDSQMNGVESGESDNKLREGTPLEAVSTDPKLEEESGEIVDSLEAYRDLKCFLDYLEAEFYPIVRKINSDSCEKIYFRDLWHLYKIGTEVYCPTGSSSTKGVKIPALGQPDTIDGDNTKIPKTRQAIWKVFHVAQGRPIISCSGGDDSDRAPAKKTHPFKIRCYSVDFDGDMFGPIYDSYDIEEWEGEKDITSLDIIPFRFHKDKANIRKHLIQQGNIFLKYVEGHQHRIYTGPTLTYHPSGRACELQKRSENIDGHVIVDFKEASRDNAKWVMDLGMPDRLPQTSTEVRDDYPRYVWNNKDMKDLSHTIHDYIYDDDHVENDLSKELVSKDRFLAAFENRVNNKKIDGKDLSDRELVLLPNRACGFILQRRSWALLRLEGLREVAIADVGWNDLKLLKGHKQMVKAQVKMHFADKKARLGEGRKSDYDLVRGKGQGLIILLHGAPGVGKTSTAECVAEYLGKPLFPITCGDLGVTASEVETALNDIFSMAQAWDCVLLLDEADVFLAQRTRTDLKRNAMVSVFLRVLEYYTGILFLTTNRVGSFDEAFKSRIHMHLYYPALNRDQTMQIWRMNMDRTMERKKDFMAIDEDGIMKYAEEHFNFNKDRNTRWNGRQIRSAFQTAAALAEYDAIEKDEKEEERRRAAKDKGEPVSPIALSRTTAKLQASHFVTVAEASHQFDEYLAEATGVTDSERARLDRERADNFRWTAARSREVKNYQNPPIGSNGRETYPPPNPPPYNQRGNSNYGGMDLSEKPSDFRREQHYYQSYNQSPSPQPPQQGKGGYLAPQADPFAGESPRPRSSYEGGGWQPSAYTKTPESSSAYGYGGPGGQMGGPPPGTGPGPRWVPAQSQHDDD